MESGPFDIGNTTRCGIGAIYDYREEMKDFTLVGLQAYLYWELFL